MGMMQTPISFETLQPLVDCVFRLKGLCNVLDGSSEAMCEVVRHHATLVGRSDADKNEQPSITERVHLIQKDFQFKDQYHDSGYTGEEMKMELINKYSINAWGPASDRWDNIQTFWGLQPAGRQAGRGRFHRGKYGNHLLPCGLLGVWHRHGPGPQDRWKQPKCLRGFLASERPERASVSPPNCFPPVENTLILT